ncbi:hypothetical protein C2845_PM04G18710 [Panicum miliaceum]|uniref:Uncharacterized protein n=1 Tax=Panicum miliaceum TaxID=4540 RepID=A0A3L6QQG4_PANMI|nr:hypothetical protein C2845_PM04G18710 [Panicum miliaceum]
MASRSTHCSPPPAHGRHGRGRPPLPSVLYTSSPYSRASRRSKGDSTRLRCARAGARGKTAQIGRGDGGRRWRPAAPLPCHDGSQSGVKVRGGKLCGRRSQALRASAGAAGPQPSELGLGHDASVLL